MSVRELNNALVSGTLSPAFASVSASSLTNTSSGNLVRQTQQGTINGNAYNSWAIANDGATGLTKNFYYNSNLVYSAPINGGGMPSSTAVNNLTGNITIQNGGGVQVETDTEYNTILLSVAGATSQVNGLTGNITIQNGGGVEIETNPDENTISLFTPTTQVNGLNGGITIQNGGGIGVDTNPDGNTITLTASSSLQPPIQVNGWSYTLNEDTNAIVSFELPYVPDGATLTQYVDYTFTLSLYCNTGNANLVSIGVGFNDAYRQDILLYNISLNEANNFVAVSGSGTLSYYANDTAPVFYIFGRSSLTEEVIVGAGGSVSTLTLRTYQA